MRAIKVADVRANRVSQRQSGLLNKQEANIGSVTGKSTSVGGDVKSRVKVGAVIQNNTGIPQLLRSWDY